MTPHNWRTKAENKESLSSLEELTVTIDAQIHVFKAKEVVKVEAAPVEAAVKPSANNPWAKAEAVTEAEEASSEEDVVAEEVPAAEKTSALEETPPTEEAPVEVKPAASSPWGKPAATTETVEKDKPANTKPNPWNKN